MSTLKHLVAERRAGDLSSDAQRVQSSVSGAQSPSLLVFKWDQHSWVLPWSYFLGAHHKIAETGEQLTLSFSLCEVVLQGERLDLLLPDIAAYRLEELRELPEKYRNGMELSAASICAIQVKTVAEKT